ncbi:MAG: glycerophosphodiester phosphodiesterase [Chloroflexota bacterium]
MTSVRRAPVLRIAHRGDWRRAPENTLPAMLAALEVPACDGVEFDVQASRDGVSILMHDDTLRRVWGRPERAEELPAAELEALGVPRLASVLEAMPQRAFLDIELKEEPPPDFVEVVEAARGAELRNAVVSSFHPAALTAVHRARPRWGLWLNAMDLSAATVDAAVELGCRGISAEWRSLDARVVAAARERGLDIASWTVRRRPTFDRLARIGVMAVCVEAAALDG